MLVGIFATDPYDEIEALLKAEVFDDIRPKAKFTKARHKVPLFDNVTGVFERYRIDSAEALVMYEVPEARAEELPGRIGNWVRLFRFSKLPDPKETEVYRSLFRIVEKYGERI